jgi:hypothetical protein
MTPAESTIGQIKTELIKPHGPWRPIDQLEYCGRVSVA